MKYFIFFVLCFVALTAADPQIIMNARPFKRSPLEPRTVVVGPTVVNGVAPLGLDRIIAPGIVGLI